MDFELMYCPYCGGDIGPAEGPRRVCSVCGKYIYSDRESINSFIRPGELEVSFNEALSVVEDDNPKKALAIADDILAATGETDFDAFFLRGAIYSYKGEDGKAFNDWKRGLELLSVYTNIDAYICLMASCISRMIFDKESEFIEFHPVKYIDKLADEIHASTNESCKAYLFYNVYMNYRKILGRNDKNSDEGFNEPVPGLFRRVVAYHRNFMCLNSIIERYLASVGYDPETYEDDDLEEAHIYDMIAQSLRRYTAGMTVGDMRRIMAHWDDVRLETNEERLDAIMPHDDGMFGKLLSRKSDSEPVNLEASVDAYVRGYLLLDAGTSSEDAQMLQ